MPGKSARLMTDPVYLGIYVHLALATLKLSADQMYQPSGNHVRLPDPQYVPVRTVSDVRPQEQTHQPMYARWAVG